MAKAKTKPKAKPKKNAALPTNKQDWLNMDGHLFEDKICQYMGWTLSEKKTHDNGIDAWANNNTVPIQIKNHKKNIGRPDIQKFVGAISNYDKGIFISWGYSPAAKEYALKTKLDTGKEVQLIKLDDVLTELLVDDDKASQINKIYDTEIQDRRQLIDDLSKAKAPSGKKVKRSLTEKEIKQLGIMIELGLTKEQISLLLETSVTQLSQMEKLDDRVQRVVNTARSLASLKVRQIGFEMATDKQHPSMTMFWLKCKEGFSETSELNLKKDDGSPIDIIDVTPAKRKEKVQKLSQMLRLTEPKK